MRIGYLASIAVLFPATISFASNGCDLNRKQVEYQIQDCSTSPCQTGAEQLDIIGERILQHRSYEGGIIYYLGRTVRFEDDPLENPKFLAQNSAHNTWLTASYEGNTLSLREDEAISRGGDSNGHLVSYQKVHIRNDCTFCDVSEYWLIGTLADGTVLGQRTFQGSKCYVSNLPPDQ